MIGNVEIKPSTLAVKLRKPDPKQTVPLKFL